MAIGRRSESKGSLFLYHLIFESHTQNELQA
jgi:hypothetical protein